MKQLNLPHQTAEFLCPVNGLCDVYEWKTGNRIPEELVHFSRPGFQLITLDKSYPPKMIFWGQGTIGKDQLNYWKSLMGYNVITSEGKDFQQTLLEIKSLIDHDIPTILFGLDMYHLPYHKKYYHIQHIPGHVVLMIGYNEKSVFVYDNSEIDIQSVPNNDLQKAWANDYIGISKKNTYFGIDMDQPNFDIADIIQQGLNRNAALYLNAPVDFIGVRGLEKLIAELPAWKTNYSAEVLKQIYLHHIEFSASTVPELPEEISGFHSGIDNPHQAGRDKLANALLKHQSNFGSKEWETAAKELRKSGKAIESIVKMFISDVHDMSYEDTDKYLPLLSEIKQIEEYVIGSLLSHRR